ncbi:neutral/alkaline non-lysosomal ceramidase N-terminal domain-containing protein [Yimella sp. cx-51]|uniref:neutral/alkaline non-lysosomal ceramidase N-terminal domain-containing protein n=1 Tax=Yimella sp. cx-51 TaxID=2770551 RepID=UPI00165DD4BE|nr:neutral/alkaline non-lysosomal ceramidase N-terminal domain-containing protein [Yimella sp. cx-51]MBC9958295.1 neutral/alkaline non-lysosomal ceramidase N-terminal domain-containing protein [Yimella sp. cx-51]QTH38257.1 neutral/alkaline non-lysosomal ceramidase N-terminal domain-containing protein [Yimella sp. cx-51]
MFHYGFLHVDQALPRARRRPEEAMARTVRTTVALALPVALAATALSYSAPEAKADTPAFLVGTGQHDITGAVAETGTFGFVANQDVEGLHQRLYSHAYVIADPATGKRIVYVSADTATIFPAHKAAVIQALTAKYGNKYTDANVMLTGTHTHVGNSGMSQDMLYQIAGNDTSAYGWDKRNFQAVVGGIVRSIEQADARVAPANLSLANGDLLGATPNRSLDVDWRIRTGTPAGTYRLQQLGDWKSGWTGKVSPYVGTSAPFTVS